MSPFLLLYNAGFQVCKNYPSDGAKPSWSSGGVQGGAQLWSRYGGGLEARAGVEDGGPLAPWD